MCGVVAVHGALGDTPSFERMQQATEARFQELSVRLRRRHPPTAPAPAREWGLRNQGWYWLEPDGCWLMSMEWLLALHGLIGLIGLIG